MKQLYMVVLLIWFQKSGAQNLYFPRSPAISGRLSPQVNLVGAIMRYNQCMIIWKQRIPKASWC